MAEDRVSFRVSTEPHPAAANDPAVWPKDYYPTRTCDCGCQLFFIYLLDGRPVISCRRCEKDHTDALRW